MAVQTQTASRIRRLINFAGMLPIAFVAWRAIREWSPRLVRSNRRLRREAASGIPIPPDELIFSSTGTRNVEWFLDSGAQTAQALRTALESIGRPIETFRDVFELGCGCGRVLRQWERTEGPRFHASDYNRRVISWGGGGTFVSLRSARMN